MHPLVALLAGPLLATAGLAVPGLGLEEPEVHEPADATVETEVESDARVPGHDAGAYTSISSEVGPGESNASLLLGASLPSSSAPLDPPEELEEREEASTGDGLPGEGSEAESSGSEVKPVPLPEPESAAIPAGLAVLGATAYAALRWRYLVPGLVPLYSRIRKDQLLENETRAKLVDVIEEEPGLSQKELCEAVDAGWGNTTYHLQRLEQAGFVRSEKQGHHRRFYRTGEMEGDDIEALGVLKNDNAEKIARYLIQEPGANQKDVCQALDISPSLAHKWIKRLEEHELVESEQEWRSKHYTPDERLNELVEAV